MVRLEINGKIEEHQRIVAGELAKYFFNMANLEGTTVQVTEAEFAKHKSFCG